jgi:galactose mutarotase-like enzyme
LEILSRIKGIGTTCHISKDETTVVLDSHGAKVLSLEHTGRNILYYDPYDISHSGIPLCFPNFGPLENGTLIVNGKHFNMGQHGFIRDWNFEIIHKSTDSVTYALKSNMDSLIVFPFAFEFTAKYSIIKNGITMELIMKNNSQKTMTIAPGVHPYFAVDNPMDIFLNTRADRGNNNLDSYRETELEESGVFKITNCDKDGLKTVLVQGVPDMHLINHGLKKTNIMIGNERTIEIVSDPDVFNRMTVWRKASDSKFICVEPAFKQNGINNGGIKIDAGKQFVTELSICVVE